MFGLASIATNEARAMSRAISSTKLARWHKDVDNAFHGWNDVWLDPQFRDWDISDALAYVRVPIEIIQGADDQYGTLRHIEIAQAECYCPVETTIVPGAGHSPHREAPDITLKAAADFANRLLSLHGEGQSVRAA